ncbi:hypothetical protein GOB57_22250 [Sinorhizobium meliloti]|nr:hypothetical protein [Sinorhizobium meliloti]
METELDFPDVSTQDAPVVMTIHGRYNHEVENWGGPVPIRMIGDRHYMPLMTAERFAAALSNPFPSHAHNTTPHFRFIKDVHKPIRRHLFEQLANNGGLAARPWPSAIEHLLREDSSPHIFVREANAFDASGGKLTLGDEAIADSERSRLYFTKGFEGYVVVDGIVWRPVPEPCYRVDADSGVIASIIPFGLAPSPYDPADAPVFTSATHFFAADQLDEAKAFSKGNGKDRFALEVLEITGCAIDIVDGRALLGHDYAAAGLHRTAKEMRHWFEAGEFPCEEVAKTVTELSRALDSSEGPLNVSAALETAVRNAVALVDVAPDWYNRRIDVDTARRIELHLERQDVRAIDVPLKGPGF